MENLGAILILLSMLGFIIAPIGLIKGNIKTLRIANRKQAGFLLLGCFVFFIIGGVMVGPGEDSTPAIESDGVAQIEQIDVAQNIGEQETNAEEVIEVSALPDSSETESSPDPKTEENQASLAVVPAVDTPQTVSGNLEVYFIDVGQADAILVKAPGGAMLIDAGNNADADLVTSYIRKQGIKKLDVVVGTHPHEDHIGGLDAVINTFVIGKVYMPMVAHTTKTYEDVLLAIQGKGLKITAPNPGTTFDIGTAKCTVLAPNSSSYDDLNNYSIVIKLEYGQTAFLLAGDAEDISEREMLNKGFDLSADVLKVGHHGSDSSTTQTFLDAVNPKYTVVMVGLGNTYGHPHKTVMDRLKAKGVTVYRTDENGTVVATSDGISISFNTKPGSYSGSASNSEDKPTSSVDPDSAPDITTPTPVADMIVYWTPGGKSYHYTDKCSTLSRSKTILSGPLSDCPKDDPCDRCVH
jgi:competence protein ComEC